MPSNFKRLLFLHKAKSSISQRPGAWRLALLVAPWLIALAVPAPRFVLLQTPPLAPIYPHCRQFVQPNYEQPSPLSSAEAHQHSPAAQFYSLADESDERREASCADNFYTPPGKPDIYADYEPTLLQDTRAAATVDRYIARFPDVPWIVAFRLQMLQSIGMQDGRVAAPIEKAYPWDGKIFDQGGSLANHLHPPQEMILTYIPATGLRVGASLRNRYFNTKLAYARRRQRLEPGNCFFDFWATRCLFALSRDREALASLHHAAFQPFYDSHQRDRLQAQEEATRDLGSPQLLSLLSASDLVRPSWLELRHTMQLATAHAAELEAAGHHAQALQIYGDLMRLCVTMRDGAYSSDEGLASCAFIAIVWAGADRTVTVREVKAKNARIFAGDWLRIGAARFAVYAAAHGRADRARQARSESESFASLRERLEPFIPHSVYWPTPLKNTPS